MAHAKANTNGDIAEAKKQLERVKAAHDRLVEL